jgi:hypothetical protein
MTQNMTQDFRKPLSMRDSGMDQAGVEPDGNSAKSGENKGIETLLSPCFRYFRNPHVFGIFATHDA